MHILFWGLTFTIFYAQVEKVVILYVRTTLKIEGRHFIPAPLYRYVRTSVCPSIGGMCVYIDMSMGPIAVKIYVVGRLIIGALQSTPDLQAQ